MRLDGRSFHKMLAHDRSLVGIVPQDDIVHAELTVEESLWYSGRLRLPSDVGRAALRREVERVLEELDIAHIRGSRIGDAVRRGISGGQRKRVNLGQELLTQSTRVLFFDEPTSGLDPDRQDSVLRDLITNLPEGAGCLLVTHDMPQVRRWCHRALIMLEGEVVEALPLPDGQPRHPYTQMLFDPWGQHDLTQSTVR